MQLAFATAAALLLAGVALRAGLRILAALHIPAAVMAGAIGLLLVQLGVGSGLATTVLPHWTAWRDALVPIIFAGLLLDSPSRRPDSGDARAVTQQAIAAWIVILGQLALGLLAGWIVLSPVFGVSAHFGQLLEVSWAGGFGSSAAWGQQHESLGEFPQARDLAVFFATAGLVWGVVSGMVIVNIGIRRGWTGTPAAQLDRDIDAAPAVHAQAGAIEPLTLQLIWLAAAFTVGIGLQWCVGQSVAWLDPQHPARQALGKLPLFMFTMMGGWLVCRALRLLRMDHLLDAALLSRVIGGALDVLIFTAVATLSLRAVAAHLPAAGVLLAIGAAWTVFTVFWLSPRLLPRRCWFELGILNYGFATATTAQGMMLLRMIDPHLKSDAAKIYALAAPATAMFIGGGVLTYLVPIAIARGWIGLVILAAGTGAGVLYFLGRRLHRGG
mgnify:CR=1 FL=1